MKRIDLFKILKSSLFAVLTGLTGGLLGAVFAHTISFVSETRENCNYLLFLLPIGAVVTALLYRIFKMEHFGGVNALTNEEKQNNIKPILAPLIFVTTAITHLLGGSGGREGAALQLGGGIASVISKLCKAKDDELHILIKSGMAAVFASVFGTPLTAAVFVLEFKASKKTFGYSILPCFISAVIGKLMAMLLRVPSEMMLLTNLPAIRLSLAGKIILLALCMGVLARIVKFSFHNVVAFIQKRISNPFVRALIFSCVVLILTLLVGDMRYNGAGMHMATDAVAGNADWFDFILKIVFTTFTLAAGFKGGEIVPTFCIGATFGCIFGSVVGMDASLAAALGLIGLFSCITNSPIGAVFLSLELFGVDAFPYVIIAAPVLWLVSAKNGLFENRFFTSPVAAVLKKAKAK